MTEHNLFIFGLGYSGQEIARQAQALGWAVGGTTRDAALADRLRKQGIRADLWSGGALPTGLADASHVVSTVGPVRGGGGDPVLAVLTAADLCGCKRLSYLSSTSVYGDHGGDWVDENTPCNPPPGAGLARLTAERGWQALADAASVPLDILRLAGIYGPGRSAFDRLRAGNARRIVKPGQVFSRIHVEDLAMATLAALSGNRPGATYNLCDDKPAPPQDIIAHAAALLGIDPPPEEDYATADLTPMARFFFQDSKRVRNTRAKAVLGDWLRHADYRAGLAAILRAGG